MTVNKSRFLAAAFGCIVPLLGAQQVNTKQEDNATLIEVLKEHNKKQNASTSAKSDSAKSNSLLVKAVIEDDSSKSKAPAKKYDKPSGVASITSPEGVKIYHKEDTSAPVVYAVIFFRNAGSTNQAKSKMGIPNLYANASILGTEKYTDNQIDQKAHNLSSEIMCTASSQALTFSIMFPKAVISEAASLLKEIICHPRFDKNLIGNRQEALVSAMQDYSSTSVVYYNFIPRLIFPKESVYSNGFFGSAEDFAKLTIDDLKLYKSRFLVTSNAEACVFGDISAEEAKAFVDQVLADLEKGTAAKDTIPNIKPVISNVTKKFYSKGPQSKILFALNTEPVTSPDRYKAQILARILGGPGLFKSRIMGRLRTQLGLIYAGGIQCVDCAHASFLIGYLEADNKKVDQVINELRDIIKELKTNGINAEELDFAKENFAGSALVELRTSSAMCSYFAAAMQNNLGTNALNDFLNGVHEVQIDDVKRLAQQTLDENNITFVVIGGNEP